MLKTVPAWRATDARAWAHATWNPWTRAVLVGACVAAFIAAVVGDTTPCSAADPTVCGPSTSFAIAIVLLAASVVLLWWRPVLACLCGVGFSVLDLLYDDVQSARFAFAGYGLLALTAAGYIVVSRRRQRLLVDRVAQHPVQLPEGVEPAEGQQLGLRAAALATASEGRAGAVAALAFPSVQVLVAVLLVAASAGSGVFYAHEVRQEQEHLTRAVEVRARVDGAGRDEYTQRLRILDGPPGSPQQVDVEPLEDLPEGSVQRLLLDPADRAWTRLVAEPADATGWLSLALGLLLLGALLLWRAAEVRAARRGLIGGGHPGVRVRFVHSPAGECLLLPADRDEVVALFDTDAAPDPQDSDLDVEQGVVFGDLRERGWAAVVGPRGVILPRGPLRVERRPERFEVSELSPDPQLSEVGTPVTIGDPAALASLPVVLRAPRPQRLLGAAMVVVAPVAAALFTWYAAESLLDLVPAVALGGALMAGGVDRLWSALRVGVEGVVMDSGFRAHTIPWGRVRDVRLDDDTLLLDWEDGDLELVPFGDLEPRSDRPGPTEELAQGIRFLISQPPSEGPPAPRSAWRPGAFAAAGSGIVLVATAAVRFLL